MPDLSQDQFDRLSAVLSDPEKAAQMTPEVRARAQAAVDGYRSKTAGTVSSLDPELPAIAQTLATQPGSTHPKGDIAAADDWDRNPESANGTVVVYDAPLALAKKNLLEHPELMPALGFSHLPPTPETVQAMDHDSTLYRSYNDYLWRQTADEASKAGKRAYRYSAAPWLQDGGIEKTVSSLGMKLKASAVPALEGLTAFLLGQDDTATFGAMRAAQEATDGAAPEARPPMPNDGREYNWHPTLGWTPKEWGAPKDEIRGGAIAEGGADAAATNALIESDNPKLYTAGQVAGALPDLPAGVVKGVGKAVGVLSKATGASIEAAGRGLSHLAPWSASNEAFDAIASGGRSVLGRLGLTEGLAPVTASVLAGGLAGGAVNLAQEGVDAASNLARTGETGTTAGDVAERTWDTAKLAGALGGLGSVVQQGSGQMADWVREGARYGGLPGKLERAGVKFEFGKGPVTPAVVKEATAEARDLGVPVEQVLAERVAPKVKEGAASVHSDATSQVDAENAAFHASPEGQAKLPVPNFTETAVKKLRGDMEARAKGGVPDPVGYKGKGREVKELFNQEIDQVSLAPVPGAVQLTPEEAQAFLSPERRVELRRAARGKEARPKAAPTEVRGDARRAAEPKPRAGEPPVRVPEKVSTVDAPASAWAEPKPPVRVTGPGRAGRPAAKPSKKPAGRTPLSADIRAQGHDTVYVVPRAHDAEHTETLLKAIDGYREANPTNKDLIELDQAARRDRDARPKGGAAGGWSAFKGEQSARLEQASKVKGETIPHGDAYPAVASYASGTAQAPTVRALRSAADRSGPETRQALDQTRVPKLLSKLEQRTAPARKQGTSTAWGAATNLSDAAMVRGTYPVLKALEGPLGPLGTGKAGRAALAAPEHKPADPKDAARSERYSRWREEYVNRRKPKHRQKEKRP